MIVDVLYRAGDGQRHGWRVFVRMNARPYIITAWGNPELYGLNNERAMTEALCRNRPNCGRIIVIVWSRRMKEKKLIVGKCRHAGKCRRATIQQAS